ncbi:MAG: diacylglycerol kinase family protein, partial [Nanoarchaeota archaeon]
KRHHLSFKNAFNGIKWALRTQPNYKVHLFFSLLALLMSWFFNISQIEFIIIFLLIIIGFVIETINTGIEATTDAITKQTRDEIRIAKDVSAAAMLIFAFGAVLIAGYIFIPKILNYILQITSYTF